MKKETKDNIVFASSMLLTTGTSVMLGWMAGWGATALVNHVFSEGLTKGQLKMFSAVTFLGSAGVSFIAYNDMYPKITGYMEDIMDMFPTTKEAKDVN